MSKTKSDLIESVMQRAGIDKSKSKRAVDAVLDVIQGGLSAGDKITLTGFGSFQIKDRPARTGRNPQTGETLTIPAKKVVRFSPGKDLKEAVQA